MVSNDSREAYLSSEATADQQLLTKKEVLIQECLMIKSRSTAALTDDEDDED